MILTITKSVTFLWSAAELLRAIESSRPVEVTRTDPVLVVEAASGGDADLGVLALPFGPSRSGAALFPPAPIFSAPVSRSSRRQEIEYVGWSSAGRGIALRSSHPSRRRGVLIVAGVHGNEPIGPRFVRWLEGRVTRGEGPMAEALASIGAGLLSIAEVNPDGVAAFSRHNAKDVDLNRNYSELWSKSVPNSGRGPLSEPESRAVDSVLGRFGVVVAFDVHGYIDWLVLPTPRVSSRGSGSRDDFRLAAWAGSVSSALAESGLSRDIKTAGGLGHGGAFEDHAFWRRGIPALCLEVTTEELGGSAVPSTPKAEEAFRRYEHFFARMTVRALMLDGNDDKAKTDPFGRGSHVH